MRAEESKKPDKRRCKTTNWREYNKALKARGSLSVWLDTDMQWLAPPTGKRGRRPTFSDAAIQFCLTIKCLFGLALRQALGFVHSLLRLAGLQWPVPDYSTLSRRQQTLKVQLPYRPSTTALDLLVDSTGIKFLGEGEWKRKKHGAEYRRQWRKVHLGIDAQTLEIRAIEVTDNSVGDAPVLPHLRAQIPPDEKLASVSADGAYDTKACMGQLHNGALRPSLLLVRMPRFGKTSPQGHRCETRPSRLVNAWAHAFGRNGAATTGAAWSRPRCIASNDWVSV